MGYSEEEQKRMYESYEDIRIEGKYNMFSREAQICSGLTEEKYKYVMEHYTELRNKFGGK